MAQTGQKNEQIKTSNSFKADEEGLHKLYKRGQDWQFMLISMLKLFEEKAENDCWPIKMICNSKTLCCNLKTRAPFHKDS